MYGNPGRIIDWKRRGEENDAKVLTLRTSGIRRGGFLPSPRRYVLVQYASLS